MEPTTRFDPAPPLALVPLTNSRAEESYPSITSEAPNGASAEILMVTDTWFPTETEGSEKVSWPDAKKVFTQLGVVLLVVVIFLVIITAFDLGAAELLTLLVTHTTPTA